MIGAALLALALCLGLASAQPQGYSNWQTGRATFYGTDAWNIHEGSCQYGYLDRNVGTGWDIAAISDLAHDYGNSCGKCKEVRCKPSNFADGYGQWLERTNVCYNDYSSVVVMVTDTCPCHYPGNFHSNKRWCCNDMYHLDLSVWAFEKLSQTKWGVIGVTWRDVPCWYKPKNMAKVPWWSKPSPAPQWYKAPWGFNKWQDKRLPSLKAHQGVRAMPVGGVGK
ncbi:MAG: RlpA-like double-psi beta-barrel-protein domain-containing protein-containing protein [Monoraphidium minutum]|nr:MAG: RlpA-like double-psi beta-barrel-protein domain-containing protein-containing protein [Monoraphidium minutum]